MNEIAIYFAMLRHSPPVGGKKKKKKNHGYEF